MKKDNKVYIFLLIILVIFFLIIFVVFGIDNIKNGNNNLTLLIEHDTIFSYKNRKWSYINNNTLIKDYNWKKYNIYLNNEKFGSYYLWKNDKWYAFDSNKNAVKLEGELLAYRSNFPLSISSFKTKEINNKKYVNKVLSQYELSLSSQFTSSYMILFDIDNDGIEEEFYILSNAFPMDFNPKYIFSFVFMVKNNKIYNIYNEKDLNISFNGCKPYFSSFIDIDKDSKYELILSCGKYSDSGVIRRLYQFNKDEFKILVTNE